MLLASGSVSPFVAQIGWCLLVAGVLAVISERVRLPSIAGFILAGMAIGPGGVGLVSDQEDIETIANLGLTLLLFLVGLEINLRALLASGRVILVSGALQVPLTLALAVGLVWLASLLGVPYLDSTTAVIYAALACAFSSTLLVAKALHERLQMDTLDGRVCIGLLVFQDLWAIVVLSLQPNLESPSLMPLAMTFTGVLVVVVAAAVFTRWLLPVMFRWVARIPELVVTLALAWCFGLGLLAVNLGNLAHAMGFAEDPSVSMEMGALIAGASMATFPYAHEVVTKVANLRDFFITLFFVALGMTVPIPDDARIILVALLVTVVLLATRYLVFLPLLYATGLDRRHAVTSSTKLAQVSEFALVICYLGLTLGHIPKDLVTVIIFAFVMTAIATPSLFVLADPLHGSLAPVLAVLGIRERGVEATGDGHGHHGARLVVLGFHRLASSLLHDLRDGCPGLLEETLVVDFNVALHDKIRATGAKVVYGDISNPGTLGHAVSGASVVICTIPDDILRGTNNVEVARQIRKLAPSAVVVVNAVRLSDVPTMYEAGADYVFSWRVETAIGLLPALRAALNGELRAYIETRRLEAPDLQARVEVLP